MPQEQAPKVARSNPQSFRQDFYATVVEATIADKT
jgi:hypothetical protein